MNVNYIGSYSVSDWWNFAAGVSGASLEDCLLGGRIAVETDAATYSSLPALAA